MGEGVRGSGGVRGVRGDGGGRGVRGNSLTPTPTDPTPHNDPPPAGCSVEGKVSAVRCSSAVLPPWVSGSHSGR